MVIITSEVIAHSVSSFASMSSRSLQNYYWAYSGEPNLTTHVDLHIFPWPRISIAKYSADNENFQKFIGTTANVHFSKMSVIDLAKTKRTKFISLNSFYQNASQGRFSILNLKWGWSVIKPIWWYMNVLHKSDPLIQVYEKVSLAMKRALEKTIYNSLETGGRLRNFKLLFCKSTACTQNFFVHL